MYTNFRDIRHHYILTTEFGQWVFFGIYVEIWYNIKSLGIAQIVFLKVAINVYREFYSNSFDDLHKIRNRVSVLIILRAVIAHFSPNLLKFLKNEVKKIDKLNNLKSTDHSRINNKCSIYTHGNSMTFDFVLVVAHTYSSVLNNCFRQMGYGRMEEKENQL